MTSSNSVSSFNLFGAKITPATRDQLLGVLKDHIDTRRQCVIASQNMHGLHVRLWHPCFERLHQLPQTYVHIDGMPLVLLCRLLGIAASREHRVTLVDWIWPLLEFAATERRRVYYLGGKDTVLEAGRAAILRRLPKLALRTHSGNFDSNDKAALAKIIDDIKEFKPHVVLVGMGMGRQERWILSNLDAIAPACVCTVGACMEYIAGAVKTPPRWLGRLGLEWFFRLTENPKRFWYRYLLEPWFVLAYIAWYVSVPEIRQLRLENDAMRREAHEALQRASAGMTAVPAEPETAHAPLTLSSGVRSNANGASPLAVYAAAGGAKRDSSRGIATLEPTG